MKETATSLCLKNCISELERAASTLQEFGHANRLPYDLVNNVILAFEEVFANIVQHGCDADDDHQIDLSVQLSAGTVTIQIIDDGRPFNPLSVAPPDLDKPFEEREVGGLGIYLVRQIMDEIAYERWQHKNKVRMRIGITGSAAAGHA